MPETGRRLQSTVPVIVQAVEGSRASALAAVEALGGEAGRELAVIDAFAARVPADRLDSLRAARGVGAVVPDRPIRLLHAVDGYDGGTDAGSSHNTAKAIGAHQLWRAGLTGKGVDIALIDTGVVPVNGLTARGKVVNGPDLSFESQSSRLRHLDTFGHGTHMAGIITGRDDRSSPARLRSHDVFSGIAPGARLVSVKVAGHNGATDVSQVIAAIDWVVQHRNDADLRVRILNLSFGTDGTQDYRFDPLSHAVEVAWRHGIFVVAAAGNSGNAGVGLSNPARNPYVMAVGAGDTKGTADLADDEVPAWSARGDGLRNPDVIAPGKSLASLRNPGSFIDERHPEGRIGNRYFRGSGTSQSAAVVSGAAALLLQQRPSLTPDQLKALLTSTATPLSGARPEHQGSGLIDLDAAAAAETPARVQSFARSYGTGSLEAARGSAHVSHDGVELRGEQDIFGVGWDGPSWARAATAGTTWSGGDWRGTTWSGSCWCGTTSSGTTWSGTTWSGTTWSGTTWSGTTWSGTTWSGTTWSGTTWSGAWSGTTWSSAGWDE